MTVSLKHLVTATGTDAGNGQIGKAQWNDEHTLTLASQKLLGRASAGTGSVEEIDLTAAGRALLDDASATDQRATLGLGSIATQSANGVAITGGTITGITDLAIVDGGTGASDPAGARANLGLGSLATLSSVDTTEITNSAVTYAKIQNVTATDRILGRSTAGAGVVEEIICTAAGRALLDDANAAAQIATLGLSASGGSNSIGFLQAGTGAVARTAQAKMRDVVSVLDFGADPTGVSDSSSAIQAAIDFLKPNNGLFPEKGGVVYFPPGTYLVNTSISTYSAIELRGSGAATVMQAGPSLTNAIFQPAATAITVIYIYGIIQGFRFVTSGSVWAIKSTAENVLCSQFRNLSLEASYGISLCRPNTYTQASVISDITSFGGIQQILAITGNFNQIERIDKEGNSGTSTEPYIYVYGANGSNVPAIGFADGNSFKKILIEGDGSSNKSPIKFFNAGNNEVEDFWTELTATNGYMIDLDNSKVRMRGLCQPSPMAFGKVKLRNGSWLYIDNFLANSEDLDWQGYFDYDANSFAYIEHVLTRRAQNVFKVSNSSNITVQQNLIQLWNENPPAGYSAQFTADYVSGQNLLVNPSFEAGAYRWNVSSGDTPTFPASEVGQGLMFQCTSTTGFQLTQQVAINASQVGQPLTIRYVAKIVGAGFAVPLIAGQAELGINRVFANSGWVTITLTYRPTTSGTLNFGLWWVDLGGTSSTIYVDEFSLCAGEQGLINPSKFGSFELNQNTFTTATAAPTTGTWKVGDRVFNSTPAIGQPKGWICTVSGTPGTWVSEGNL